MSSMDYFYNANRNIREPLKTSSLSAYFVRKWFIISAKANYESVFRGELGSHYPFAASFQLMPDWKLFHMLLYIPVFAKSSA